MARVTDAIKTTTGVEPISLAELKVALGVTSTEHDAYITYLGEGAREMCEARTNVSLVDTTITATIDCQKGWLFLPYGPVKAISSIQNYNTTGTLVGTLTAGSDYFLKNADNTELIFIKELPSYFVKVTYTTGWTTVPNVVKAVIAELVIYWYDNTEDVMLYTPHALSVLSKLNVISRKDTL